MLPILAETVVNVTSVQLGGWIACAAFVLVIVRNVMGIKADRMRMHQGTVNQPVHVANPVRMEGVKEYAEKHETAHSIKNLEEKDHSLELQLSKCFGEMKLAAETRAAKITEDIGLKIENAMKEVHHRLNMQDVDIAEIRQEQKAHDEELKAWRT